MSPLLGHARRLDVDLEERMPESTCAVFDVDGTLVDSNYQHALAWYRAFRAHGAVLPVWRIHRHIGMGGDRLVAALAGEDYEHAHGDDVRAAWKADFDARIDEVALVPGATELLAEVKDAGLRLVLASSGKPDHVDRYLDQLGARDLVDAWTSSEDVGRTKPAPDLLEVALEQVGGGPAVTFGDSTWDCEAAVRLGVPAVAVRTGGFSVDELREAGASDVFDSLDDLRADLDRVLRL
jgi:HAD superfamily hydrolase (TIGR01509 family)